MEHIIDTINRAHISSLSNKKDLKIAALALFEFIEYVIEHDEKLDLNDFLFYLITVDLKNQDEFINYTLDVLEHCITAYVNREDYIICKILHDLKNSLLEYDK